MGKTPKIIAASTKNDAKAVRRSLVTTAQ
jgi:hypothetical protein